MFAVWAIPLTVAAPPVTPALDIPKCREALGESPARDGGKEVGSMEVSPTVDWNLRRQAVEGFVWAPKKSD